MKKIIPLHNKAFTLAEVLITLGIIGVVAAITIPTLMKNIQDAQYKTAYKKAFSVASQALASANQQYLLVPTTGEGDANHANNFLAWMDQFKVAKKCINDDYQNCWNDSGEKYGLSWDSTGFPQHANITYAFIDNSGMTWSMYYSGLFRIFVDTNGFNKPNQWGKDRFVLNVSSAQDINGASGVPIKIIPVIDNDVSHICSHNKCETQQNYFGTSWLYN